MKQFLTIFCVLALATLTGCTTAGPAPQLVAEPDGVTLRLANAADRAATALDTLASIEQKRTPTILPPLAASAPPELRRSVTVNWVGPVQPLLQQLADRAGYEFQLAGNAPSSAIILSINVRNQPVIETLRDAGLQLGQRAKLRVDAQLKLIELVYATTEEITPTITNNTTDKVAAAELPTPSADDINQMILSDDPVF